MGAPLLPCWLPQHGMDRAQACRVVSDYGASLPSPNARPEARRVWDRHQTACSAGKNRLVLETSWHRENQPAQFHPASTHAANRKPSSFQTDGANSTGCVQPRKKWRQQIFHSVAPNPSSIQIKIQHLK